MADKTSKQGPEGSDEWVIPYETNGENFEFTFRRDGSATCLDVVTKTKIDFQWEPEKTIQGLEEDPYIKDALEGITADIFWSEINEELGDEAVISDEEMSQGSNGEVEFTCGSQQDLEELSALVLHSFPSVWSDGAEAREISFAAAGDHVDEGGLLEEGLELGDEIDEADKARVKELLRFAFRQNKPVGEYLEYNDGAQNRRSGYSWYSNTVEFEIERPSFHETAEARHTLRKQLQTELSPADLDRLLPLS
jgi:hypothetical protein